MRAEFIMWPVSLLPNPSLCHCRHYDSTGLVFQELYRMGSPACWCPRHCTRVPAPREGRPSHRSPRPDITPTRCLWLRAQPHGQAFLKRLRSRLARARNQWSWLPWHGPAAPGLWVWWGEKFPTRSAKWPVALLTASAWSVGHSGLGGCTLSSPGELQASRISLSEMPGDVFWAS